MSDSASISCEPFFQFNGIRVKFHPQQNLLIINLNAENILYFLISQI